MPPCKPSTHPHRHMRRSNACPSGNFGYSDIPELPSQNSSLTSHRFYFFFENRDSPSSDAPVILWMTGGPGCSSELAVFYENGPYHIRKDLTLVPNPYGWDAAGSIIYVDQVRQIRFPLGGTNAAAGPGSAE